MRGICRTPRCLIGVGLRQLFDASSVASRRLASEFDEVATRALRAGVFAGSTQTEFVDLIGCTPGDPLQLFGIGLGSIENAKPLLIGIVHRNAA